MVKIRIATRLSYPPHVIPLILLSSSLILLATATLMEQH
jgi:hypothetical protein